jgi:hypothetical protein
MPGSPSVEARAYFYHKRLARQPKNARRETPFGQNIQVHDFLDTYSLAADRSWS